MAEYDRYDMVRWQDGLRIEEWVSRDTEVERTALRHMAAFTPALLALGCTVAWHDGCGVVGSMGQMKSPRLVHDLDGELTGLYYWLGEVGGLTVQAGIRATDAGMVIFHVTTVEPLAGEHNQELIRVLFMTNGRQGAYQFVDADEEGRHPCYAPTLRLIGPGLDVPSVPAAAIEVGMAANALLRHRGEQPAQAAA